MEFVKGNIKLINADCMDIMKAYPDNYFDLAVVDPPYGIDMDGGNIGGDSAAKATNYTKKDWDKEPPNKEYWKELFRVSKNQIIWGANHFISKIPFDSSCWVVWDKDNSGNFADAELAYTSFKTAVRIFKWRWNGMLQQNMKKKQLRIHPTEKPLQLYEWLFINYAKKDYKILDTHIGSMSIALALHNLNIYNQLNLSLVGCELDKEYFDNGIKRVKEYTQTQSLFL